MVEIIALISAGLLVGFINTLAGGGSIISLSVLMMLGLPAPLANGTNRIAITIQTLVATTSFKQQKVLETKKASLLSIPAILGSLIGAWLAVDMKEDVFEIAIGVIMLIMLFFILYKPHKFIYGRKNISEKPLTWSTYLVFFFIGIYGGFIHMGVGYFLLAGIVGLAGFDLVKANAIKVFVVLAYAPFTLVVFLWYNQVNWKYGLILAIGAVIGALVASRLAVSKGVVFVKWVIVCVILLTSADMFGIIDIKGVISTLLEN
ncbi:MAG: sulfite exporter TauE/SafE family protein [Lentimicrobiaceae bacterium]|nr:sulfite exporter TauE/SafE family protein [Lentimicrobiaceae bacterium]MBT4468673.1 sulfite exporter TauE/SafE family protein [Lentimicrobiaceae bacterium]MBT5668704.1 sulfite exporter TauE/SafE family protein [Lentimicrobiaceae bacterium]MBT5731543.1 sulfite exporter TauE/SafE family protein [Lentimicrobiaceae bacterium]MBT6673343.1 sulfite exporter TauE/SafE family protein [Lentimicrobiaceae bacterium]